MTASTSAAIAAPTLSAVVSAHPCEATALVGPDGPISYGALGALIGRRADELALPTRSMVVLAGTNTVEFVVTYLALLHAGHVPLLSPPGDPARRLAEAWGDAAIVQVEAPGATRVVRPPASTAVDRTGGLHPDLALLLSTSGSTGSPKLVRLSHRNLVSNASAIADYLALTPADRGITSLPLHYCYGLSVLHSHLVAGASVVVTDTSVVDPCFLEILGRERVSTLAGVPHTYDMLERCDPDAVLVPSMRALTQAGGRLAPEAVARWAGRANERGIDLYVMYGQTEATARMAYLPPDLAARRPDAIGVPIPGGAMRIEPVDQELPGIGELVYRGENVMLGYAFDVSDLSRGADLTELRTGDLARYDPIDEVFVIVGRRSRFVKPFGLRIDLDQLEADLERRLEIAVAAAGDDDAVQIIATSGAAGPTDDVVRGAARAITGLPDGRIEVRTDVEIPRTSSGKVDHAAVRRSVSRQGDAAATRTGAAEPATAETVGARVMAAFEIAIGRALRADETSASFTSLGGDSLGYVECSLRLERVLGALPVDWHLRPISDLIATAQPTPRRFARVDTTVVLRAAAISFVVATHMHLWYFPGGAHLLLAVVGYNLARFTLPIEPTAERVRSGLRSVARVAVPVVLWIGVGMLSFGAYGIATLLLVNNYAGPASHAGDEWHFWFIEVFAQLVLLTVALLAIPPIRRVERRWPYLFPLALLAVALVLRMEWAWMGDWYNLRYRTHGVAFFFVLGWLVYASRSTRQRLATTALCIAVVPGFFQYAPREWFIATALVVLLWAREVPWPRPLVGPVGVLAAASMWIYVSHFALWPLFTSVFVREVAYVLTIAGGIGVWLLMSAPARWSSGWRPRPLPRSTAARS